MDSGRGRGYAPELQVRKLGRGAAVSRHCGSVSSIGDCLSGSSGGMYQVFIQRKSLRGMKCET